MNPLLFNVAVGFITVCSLLLVSVPWIMRTSMTGKRMQEVVSRRHADRPGPYTAHRLREIVLKLTRTFRGGLGFAPDVKLKARLLNAGFSTITAPDFFFAAQFLIPVVLAVAGTFIPNNTVFWVLVLCIVGYVAPNFWLTLKTTQRKNRIRRSIPDAIDLLVICVDAGLGLDQALLRVGHELELSHPEIQDQFNQVQLEQRAGVPRLEAWESLADRTKIDEFAAFVSMLTQTDRFGTPIAKALGRFADDLRLSRRQHAEEAAVKTKIKIIFPLVLCIFPCLFIILLAPAILGIMNGLKGMGN